MNPHPAPARAPAHAFAGIRRPLAWLLIATLAGQPVAASAQVIAAAGAAAGSKPTVGAAPNGMPLVQIAAPNGSGVSHNQYQQYSVDARGVLLNNSRVIANTQLAGYIAGNPNLAGGSARIILNEVTGPLPSDLRGYTEVAGTRAEVVIANPNGITCAGCGFINASRAVLTTGTPVFGGSGSLEAYRVTGGQIAIEGSGLDAAAADQLDLIARSVAVSGGIWARNLNVVAGPNRVAHADLTATPIAGDGPAPVRAIDVALLGGMYAGKIRLLATEAGVGVNNAGTLAAQGGDFTLDAAGHVTLGGAVSAGGNLTLTAASLAAGGTLGAGIDAAGQPTGSGNLTIATSGTLAVRGQNLAGGNLTLTGDTLDLAGARSSAGGSATLTAVGDIAHGGGTLQTGGDLTLSAGGAIDNAGGLLSAGQTLASRSASFSNQGGEIVQAGGGMGQIATTGAFDNRLGTLTAKGSLAMTVGTLDNRGGTLKAEGARLDLTAAGAIDNANGKILAAEDASLAALTLGNGGTLAAGRNLAVTAATTLDNAAGSIGAGQDLTLAAATVANAGGEIFASRDLALAANALGGDGTLQAGRDLALSLDGNYTHSAANRIRANRHLSFLLTGDLINQGTLAAVGELAVTARNLDNQAAGALQGSTARLTAATDFTNAGLIDAPTVAITAATLANTGSVFGQDITVTAGDLTNRGSGVMAAADALKLYVAGTLQNLDGGLLYSANDLAIAGAATRGADGRLATPTARLLNSSAAIEAGRDLEITATTVDNRRSELITASRTLSSSILVAQERDESWSRSVLGMRFINARYVDVQTTVQTCDLSGRHCTSTSTSETLSASGVEATALGTTTSGPVTDCSDIVCRLVTTTITATLSSPLGASVWHIDAASSVPTFTIVERGLGGRRQTIVSEALEEYLVSATPEASILAGRDAYLRAGAVTNTASRIQAAGTLDADVGSLANTGVVLSDKTRNTTWVGRCSDIKSARPGVLGHCESGWIWTADVRDTITGTTATLDAVVAGHQSLTLTALTVANATVDAQGLPPGGLALATAPAPSARPYAFTLPRGGLYRPVDGAGARYLVETDPRFTRYRHFVSSDYFLTLLGLDLDAAQKRLGDGFVEQQLVRDQLLRLGGRSTPGPYGSADAEYRALLEAGAAYARAFDLAPGVTLTREQVAALAYDMVWLEERQVAGQSVLVPVVYLAGAPQAQAAGGLIGGGAVTRIEALAITNSGTITSRGQTTLIATQDIANASGTIRGEGVTLVAGNDIALTTATAAVELHPGQTYTHEGGAGRVAGQSVTLLAGRDVVLAGGAVEAGHATLAAGRDLAVGSQAVTTEQHLQAGGSRYDRSATEQRGSRVATTGDLKLEAGGDLVVAGSEVRSGGDLTARAGGTLALAAAYATDTRAYDARSKEVKDAWQQTKSTARTSTLEAGGNVRLEGAAMTAEGAKVQAGGDLALATLPGAAAGAIALLAAHDRSSAAGMSSKTGQGSSQQGRFRVESDSATGTVLEAGGNLSLRSAGATTIEGGALAAGKTATIVTGGDLTLAAATSSRSADIHKSETGRRLATTLDHEFAELRQLLTTIRVGEGATLTVGGNFSAAVGETRPDGTLNADRMTTKGVVRGGERQQVNVARTGDGANADPQQSQVLGSLANQGIKNHRSESFAPTAANAAQSGAAALQQYVASGLLEVRGNPRLAAVLQNIGGATLAVKDDAGNLRLTVAGEAKVQAVYNTLRLTETFDVQKFADQQTAQVVTLVAAIALTIVAPGTGAALLSTSGTVTTAMANAAFISMTSTMVGQLAGGASFGDAFAAGLKAGTSAALTAGILNAPVIDTGSGLQSINQLAGVADVAGTGSRLAGFNLDNLGQNLGGMALRGVVNAGVNQLVYGKEAGSFGTAFANSVVGDLSAMGANAIGQTWGGGENPFVQTIAHAGLGATAAKLTGRDVTAGALGGATESVLGNLVDLSTDAQGNYTDATRGLYTLGVVTLGGMISAATGHDALTAMQAAQNAAQNNRLATQAEKDRIKQLAGGDREREARLTAAACSLIHCADGVPPSDPDYAALKAMQEAGAGYGEERDLLSRQTGQVGKTVNGQLFQYSWAAQYITDPWSQASGGTRLLGAAGGVAGAAGVLGSGALCTTGLGCAAGAVTGTVSLDVAQAGVRQAVTGQASVPYGEQVLQSLGLSPQTAALTYAVLGVGAAGVGSVAANGGTMVVSGTTTKTSGQMSSVDGEMVSNAGTGSPLNGTYSGESLAFEPSSRVALVATPGKTTTILGNYRQDMKGIIEELGNPNSVEFGPRPGGFNVLNVPDSMNVNATQFWSNYNQPWLNNAVTRDDIILMATKPQFGYNSMLFRVNDATGMLGLSVFGKEYFFLRKNGYTFEPSINQMVR